MLKKTSEEFRIFFLIQFTKELIKNSETAEAIAIKERLKQKIKDNIEKKENKKRLQEIIKEKSLIPELKSISVREKIKQQQKIPRKKIPQLELIPPTIQHIKPIPTTEQIDLGKINPLIKDLTVINIECKGPGKNLIVKRTKGEKRLTAIKLTEQEIKQTIQKFSQAAKVPIEQGTFKAAVGKLIISAIISDIDSKFLITKMSPDYY